MNSASFSTVNPANGEQIETFPFSQSRKQKPRSFALKRASSRIESCPCIDAQNYANKRLIGKPLAALAKLLGEGKPKTDKAREKVTHRMAPHPANQAKASDDGLLTAAQVFEALSEIRPANAILVEESPSNLADLHRWWPITEPASFFTFASGGLGWNLPASVGIALGERETGRNRPVIMIIGDGSFQYSVQSIWTAAQHHLPILFIVLRNGEYCILKSFAELEETPGVPGLDLPGIDIVSLAKGYGCDGARLDDLEAIKRAAAEAWTKPKPTVLEIPISPQVPPLI